MIATFCLRLALGMLGALPLLSPKQMHPRFFRTHFLTALGLCIVAAIMAPDGSVRWLIILAAVATFAGAVVWNFEKPTLGWIVLAISIVALIASLGYADWARTSRLVDNLTAAALLGFAITAMLVGHSYLISPALTIRPLMHQLAALGVAVLLRTGVAGTALWFWTADHDLTNLNDETVLWLPVRWGIGLLGPLVFGWLAYRTAKIRSTQSATGILYVVVILALLGELTSLLLLRDTGLPL